MFSYGDWKEILCVISCIKPECVDNKKIIERLEYRWDYNEEVLDNLYSLKAISLDEYIKYLEKYLGKISERYSNRTKFISERIEKAKEQGENFDPHMFYCCCYSPM